MLTGLLYYFGWLYARTFALGLGIDPALLDYGTEDYLLRSVDLLFVPLAMFCGVVLVLRWLHAQLTRRLSAHPHRRFLTALTLALAAGGVLLAIPATLTVFRPNGVELAGFRLGPAAWVPRWALPVAFAIGVGLVDYAVQVRRRLGKGQDPVTPTTWSSASQRAAVGGLVLLALFWAVTVYAQDVGRMRVSTLRHDATEWQAFPAVVVYSASDLLLDGPGVAVARCDSEEAAYRFRYTGLRLFTYADDRYVLLPSGWNDDGGPAAVITHGDELRVEFLPGSEAPAAADGCPSDVADGAAFRSATGH